MRVVRYALLSIVANDPLATLTPTPTTARKMMATRRAGRARQFDHLRHQFSRARPIAGAGHWACDMGGRE
jgi:hypothetical protein